MKNIRDYEENILNEEKDVMVIWEQNSVELEQKQ